MQTNKKPLQQPAVCLLCGSTMPANLLDQRGICLDCGAYNANAAADRHLLETISTKPNLSRGKPC
jgi:ribosomal protein L40E